MSEQQLAANVRMSVSGQLLLRHHTSRVVTSRHTVTYFVIHPPTSRGHQKALMTNSFFFFSMKQVYNLKTKVTKLGNAWARHARHVMTSETSS